MKEKRATLSIGFLLLLAGLIFWIITPFPLPNPPAPIFSSGVLVELWESAAQNDPTIIARENKEEAIAVGSARVFACDWADGSDSEMAGDSHQEFLDSLDKMRVELTRSLANSTDPEHLLTAALVGFDRKSKEHFAAMEKALAADPGNPLTLWVFLKTCWRNPDETVCQNGRIEKRAVLADGGNGRLWGEIATYRFLRGDTTEAFDALTKANTATQFNGYFIEHVEMFERGYAAATDKPYSERIVGAIAIRATMLSNFNPVFQGCKEQAAKSAEWLQTCIEYGKRLERDGRTYFATAIGIGLQQTMYDLSGDARKKTAAVFRRQLIGDIMNSGNRSDDQELLLFDDQVMADYIAEWSAHGELRAMQFVKGEVVRLSQQPGYDPCKLKKAGESATNG